MVCFALDGGENPICFSSSVSVKPANEPCITQADPLELLWCRFQWRVLVSHPGLSLVSGWFRRGGILGGGLLFNYLTQKSSDCLEKSRQWQKWEDGLFFVWGTTDLTCLSKGKGNVPLGAICKSLLSLLRFYYFLHNYGVLPCSEQSPVHKYCTSNYKDVWKRAEPDKMGHSQAAYDSPRQKKSWPGVLETDPVMQQNMTLL